MAHPKVRGAVALWDTSAHDRAGARDDEFFALDPGLQVHPGGRHQVATTRSPRLLAHFWPKTGGFPGFWCKRLPTDSAMEALLQPHNQALYRHPERNDYLHGQHRRGLL